MAKRDRLHSKHTSERRGFAAFKFAWQERVQSDDKLPASACGFAIVLNKRLDVRTRKATMHMQKLADECHMTSRNLRDLISRMVERGHLQVDVRRGATAKNTFSPIGVESAETGSQLPVSVAAKPEVGFLKTGSGLPVSLYCVPFSIPKRDRDQVSHGGQQGPCEEGKQPAHGLDDAHRCGGKGAAIVTDRGVLIRISTQQATAWLAYERRRDQSIRKLDFLSTSFGLGVWRPTEWPPDDATPAWGGSGGEGSAVPDAGGGG